MSADTIRRAAALVREHAQAATEGPWKTHDTSLDTGGHTATVLTRREALTDTRLVAWLPTFSHEPWNDDTNAWANASHIALWHPAVALAVAEWLDQAASWADAAARHHGQDRLDTHALRVARALLGEETDRG